VSNFNIDDEIIVPGFIQALHFSPKSDLDSPLFSSSFSVVNVYLPSGNDKLTHARRLSMLAELKNYHFNTDYLLVIGT
jgi:hypothetical protein